MSRPTNPKSADLVDCNYMLRTSRHHVCIKDMPREECSSLFEMSIGLDKEDECVCDQPGREKKSVSGTGYTQYDCK